LNLMRLKTHNQSINNKVNESMHNQINENNYELETQHVRFNQQLDTDTL
jgi:ABC-type phosphate transport system auxiliary subunit